MCIHYAAKGKSAEKCQVKCRFHVVLMSYLSGQDCLATTRIRDVKSTTGKSFLQSEKISLTTIHQGTPGDVGHIVKFGFSKALDAGIFSGHDR
jgi:hypothetical protein